jgi:hypothetical protein
MKAQELRIGNYYLAFGVDLKQVETLTKDKILIDFTPIQLTEEWLLNFGFTQCENNYWYEKEITNLRIKVSCNLSGMFCIEYKDDIVTIKDCCYNVHNLQNLYFVLTGEELVVKE